MELSMIESKIYEWTSKLPCLFCKEEELLCVNIAKTSVQAIVFVREDLGVDFCQSYDVSNIDDLESADCEALALKQTLTLLKQDLKTAGYAESLQCVVALEGYCYREELEMPLLPRAQLQEALDWELPEHIPWEQGSYSYDFSTQNIVNNEEKTNNSQQIKIYALPKQTVANVLELLREQGWSCLALTVTEAVQELEEESIDLTKVDFYEGFYRPEQLLHLKESYKICIQLGWVYYLKEILVDFLPARQKRWAWLEARAGILTLLSKIVLLLSMLLIVGANVGKYYASYELKQQQQSSAKLSHWEQRIKDWQQLDKQKQALQKEISALTSQKLYWSKYLQHIAYALPQGVWLTKLQQGKLVEGRDSSLVIWGKAQRLEQLTNLVEALKKSKAFKEVELTHTQEGKNVGELLEFTLQTKITKGSAKNEKEI